MSYLGRGVDKISNIETLDNITFNGASSYTLQKGGVNFVPTSAAAILISIDGVVQSGNFTVSSSTIDFGTAIAGTSTCNFIIHLGTGVLTTPSDGSVSADKIASSAVTRDKLNLISDSSNPSLIAKGDGGSQDGYIQLNCRVNSHGIKLKSPPHSAGATYTLTFPNSISADQFLKTDGSGNLSFAAAGGTNTPAFEAYLNTTTGVTDNTFVKATFDTERFDTNNTFSSSRFTPAVAGKYHCYTGIRLGNDGTETLSLFQIAFYKNGSAYLINTTPTVIFNYYSINNFGAMLTQTIDLDADDYVEVYVKCDTSVGSPDLANGSFFGAYKIIE